MFGVGGTLGIPTPLRALNPKTVAVAVVVGVLAGPRVPALSVVMAWMVVSSGGMGMPALAALRGFAVEAVVVAVVMPPVRVELGTLARLRVPLLGTARVKVVGLGAFFVHVMESHGLLLSSLWTEKARTYCVPGEKKVRSGSVSPLEGVPSQ